MKLQNTCEGTGEVQMQRETNNTTYDAKIKEEVQW